MNRPPLLGPVVVFPADVVGGRRDVRCFEFLLGDRRYAGFVIRRRGLLRAYLNECPHQRVALDRGSGRFYSRNGAHLICRFHGALFRPDDGVCVRGPCAGDALPTLEAVEFFGNCQIFVPRRLREELLGSQRVIPPH